MTRRIERQRAEAIRLTAAQDHDLVRFQTVLGRPAKWSYCRKCGLCVAIDAVNDTVIGDALRLQCEPVHLREEFVGPQFGFYADPDDVSFIAGLFGVSAIEHGLSGAIMQTGSDGYFSAWFTESGDPSAPDAEYCKPAMYGGYPG